MGRKWVYKPGHPKANERGFVAWEDYGATPDSKALDAPVLTGRFYENQSTIDGKDISSRQKMKDYMAREGVTHTSDYGPDWSERVKAAREREASKERRQALDKAWWQHFQK